MWRQWFNNKRVTLVIADDGMVLSENKRVVNLIDGKLSLSALEHGLRQYREKLRGKQVKLVLAGTWVKLLVLPWQEHLYRREDWEALGQQALRKASANDSEKWVCRVTLAEYGRPVFAMGLQDSLHQLLMTLAAEFSFKWEQIKPLNTALFNQNLDANRLVVVEPGLVTLMQRDGEGLTGVSVLKPPVGQELNGLQQHLTRLQMVGQDAQPLAKTKVIVSSILAQNWSELQAGNSNVNVIKDRSVCNSHAQWAAKLSHVSH